MKASLRNAYEKDAVRIVPKNFDIYAVGVEGRASIYKDVQLLSFKFLYKDSCIFFFRSMLYKKKLR